MNATHNSKIEEAVLGRLMVFPQHYHTYSTSLNHELFYNPHNQKIYKAIARLADSQNINAINIEHELRNEAQPENGWAWNLLNMQESVGNDRMDYYVAQLTEMHRKRKIEEMVLKARAIDMSEPLHEVIGQLSNLYTWATSDAASQQKTTHDQIADFLRQLQEPEGDRIKTGINKLNELTAGYRRGNLIIYAARPGMGKTAMMVGDIIAACKADKEVHVVSAEMTAEELIERMAIQLTGIDGEKIRTQKLEAEDWKKINAATAQIENWKLTIDESTDLTQILTRAKAEGARRKLDLIAADYIQRINGTKDQREQEINEITTSFKNLAKNQNCVVVALAQLNRNLETRADRRPMLSDLRESGSIEQEADMVLFLHRPEQYREMEWEDGTSTEGEAEFIIAKYRAGRTGKIRVGWDGARMRYEDLRPKQIQDYYDPYR